MPSSEVLNIQVTQIDNGYLVLREGESLNGTVYVTSWQHVIDEIQAAVIKNTPRRERDAIGRKEPEFRKGGAVQTDIEEYINDSDFPD
jgi:hypothetical protein